MYKMIVIMQSAVLVLSFFLVVLPMSSGEDARESRLKVETSAMRAEEIILDMKKALHSEDPFIRLSAAYAFGKVSSLIQDSVISGLESDDPGVRRAAVSIVAAGNSGELAALKGISILGNAFHDESIFVRRHAMEALGGLSAATQKVFSAAMASDDRAVRRTALSALADGPADAAIPYLSRALDDSDPEFRRFAVGLLADISPRTGQVMELLEIASEDRDAGVQKAANIALEPFSIKPIDEVPLRERPEFEDKLDRIEVVISKRLSGSGWKFKKDLGLAGHRQEWFCPGYEDSDWADIRIEEPWDAGYIGVGWYRKSIELPERPEHIAAELKFEGVDENAWVWVNGEYAGGQAVGPAGWNRPFRVDITGELRWNTENQITVRVKNTIGAGGVWRPVYLEVLNMD